MKSAQRRSKTVAAKYKEPFMNHNLRTKNFLLSRFWTLFIFSAALLLLPSGPIAADVTVSEQIPVKKEIMDNIFSGGEKMHYSISWSGGIKIGDLYIQVIPLPEQQAYRITAKVQDYGLFRLFYPVDDRFTTLVQGPLKLPYHYDVLQIEGHKKSRTHRVYEYDQEQLKITYRKNNRKPRAFTVPGRVYNEFSAFYITRCLDFNSSENITIPTFADKKRHNVPVKVVDHRKKESIWGKIEAIKVIPKLDFKGLYDKEGDTEIWLTDDECRIPIIIKSRIVVGSLTARLIEYSNTSTGCPWAKSHKLHNVKND